MSEFFLHLCDIVFKVLLPYVYWGIMFYCVSFTFMPSVKSILQIVTRNKFWPIIRSKRAV